MHPSLAFLENPPDEQVLQDGAVAIIMGNVNDVKRARDEAQPDKVA
jgi:hypothetical protein